MMGQLAPDISEEITGHVEIRRIFKPPKIGNIAGCYVLDGKVTRDSKARLLRDDTVVWTGEIGTLRREADDAKEVREGFECGIVLRNYNDIQEGRHRGVPPGRDQADHLTPRAAPAGGLSRRPPSTGLCRPPPHR